MKNLFYRLIIFLNTVSEKDTNYNIAYFMANNFYRISDMRISELAEECYVSPATISRFCRALGYENYAHLKQECYSFHSMDKKFNNLINISLYQMKDDPKGATQEYVNQVVDTLSQLPDALNWDDIDKAIHYIHDSDNVVFFGTQFSNSAAIHLQTDLLMLEKFSVAYMDSERQLECAKQMTKDSVAVIISVNGNYHVSGHKILQYLKKSGCKVILFTCEEDSRLKIDTDITIHMGTPKDGKTGKNALLTTVELFSLRYYTLYYPSLVELVDHLY